MSSSSCINHNNQQSHTAKFTDLRLKSKIINANFPIKIEENERAPHWTSLHARTRRRISYYGPSKKRRGEWTGLLRAKIKPILANDMAQKLSKLFPIHHQTQTQTMVDLVDAIFNSLGTHTSHFITNSCFQVV